MSVAETQISAFHKSKQSFAKPVNRVQPSPAAAAQRESAEGQEEEAARDVRADRAAVREGEPRDLQGAA